MTSSMSFGFCDVSISVKIAVISCNDCMRLFEQWELRITWLNFENDIITDISCIKKRWKMLYDVLNDWEHLKTFVIFMIIVIDFVSYFWICLSLRCNAFFAVSASVNRRESFQPNIRCVSLISEKSWITAMYHSFLIMKFNFQLISLNIFVCTKSKAALNRSI